VTKQKLYLKENVRELSVTYCEMLRAETFHSKSYLSVAACIYKEQRVLCFV